MKRGVLTLSLAVAGGAFAVEVVGTSPPWQGEATYRSSSASDALREVYGGRAEVALVSRPGVPPPPGVGEMTWVPVGVYAVRIAYRMPGVNLKLDVRAACGLFSGRIRTWNDPSLARLNPDESLPNLPVLSVARLTPNAASFAFADACVRSGHWPRAWRKSHWVARAVSFASNAREAQTLLGATGSVGVLGPRERTPAGSSEARVMAAGGEFVPPRADLGLTSPSRLPKGPAQFLPFPAVPGAYPFRGLVWAVVSREQRYRERSPEDAEEVVAFLEALRERGGPDVTPLPPAFRAPIELTYGGRPLRESVDRQDDLPEEVP